MEQQPFLSMKYEDCAICEMKTTRSANLLGNILHFVYAVDIERFYGINNDQEGK